MLQLAYEHSADAAWTKVAELQQASLQHAGEPPLKLATSISLAGSGGAEPSAAANGCTDRSAQAPLHPRTMQSLAKADSLLGVWGTQMFGLADAGVLMRIEVRTAPRACS